MPNEMIRPCTWKGETFDAIRVKRVLNTGNGVTICLNMGQSFILQCDANDVDSLYFEAITTIAEALDEPVLATEEVLAGLYEAHFYSEDFTPQFLVDTDSMIDAKSSEEVPEYYDDWVNLTPKWDTPFLATLRMPNSDEEEWCYTNYAVANGSAMYTNNWEGYQQPVRVLGHKIKANGCSKTAEYLRNFYRNGVRINKEKES